MNKHSKLMWNTLLILVQKTLTSFQNKLICFHSLTPLKMRFFRKVHRLAISKMYQSIFKHDFHYSQKNTDTFFGFPILIILLAFKNLNDFEMFKSKIRKWKPKLCKGELCLPYVRNRGYVNISSK